MKKYRMYYNPSTGLTQPKDPITAYCYNYKDGFFHFYDSKENLDQSRPFRSMNSMSVMSIDEIFELKT